VQDAWLCIERGLNGLGADDVRVSLFDVAFPDPARPAAPYQLSLANFDEGDLTRASILMFVRDPSPVGLASSVDAQTIGEHLYKKFVGGAVQAAFAAVEAVGAGVRLWIEILEPEPARPDGDRQLADLPWEALAVPDPLGAGLADFLALRRNWTVVRALTRPRTPPQPADRSLRILVVRGQEVLIPASAAHPEMRSDQDAALVEQPFQGSDVSFHLEVAAPESAKSLRTALAAMQAHVVHYIGHGGSAGGDRHALLFRNGPPAAWMWDTTDVAQDVRNEAVPRLAVVNACHEAGTLERSTSLARAFLSGGAVAAIGMQARVRADYALPFTRGFYSALAAGVAPDVAIRAGRLAIRDAGAGLLRRDWMLPVLTLSVPPDQVLPKAEYADIVKRCELRRDLRDRGPFVDRTEQRRDVLTGLVPWNGSDAVMCGVLVIGLDGSGKSWFAQRCLAELAQTGAVVRYCDLTGQGDASAREVIAHLRDGWRATVRSFAYDPLPDAFFVEYDAVRAELRPIVAASGDTALTAPQIARLFATFRKGLEALAASQRVVIVLDQFNRSSGSFSQSEFTTYLYPQLVQPILQGKIPGANILLALRESDAMQYGLTRPSGEPIEPALRKLEVPFFKEADARRLFFEYCGFQWNELESKLFEVLALKILNSGQWRPRELAKFRDLLGRGREEG
jgi:hypothetical protein